MCIRDRNKILKDKLKKAGISYEEVNPFEEKIESAEEYDLDPVSYTHLDVYKRQYLSPASVILASIRLLLYLARFASAPRSLL